MFFKLFLFLLLLSPINGQVNGYAAYSGGSASVESNNVDGSSVPVAPMAPPRVPLPEEASHSASVEASLGYRPPPPPLRRDEKSIGKCSFG